MPLFIGFLIVALCITPGTAVAAGVSVSPAEINISHATTTMNTAIEEGNWPRAAAYAQLIVINDPTAEGDVWCKWSFALRKMGNYEEALTAANTAVAKNHENNSCYLERGYVHLALGNWLEARMDGESALRDTTDNAAAYNIIALGLMGQDDGNNALVAVESALQYEPENAEYLNTKGMILIQNGEYGKAVSVLTDAVEASNDGYITPYPDASTPEQNLNEAQRLYNENSVPPYLIFGAAALILIVAAGAGLMRRRK